MSVLQRTNSAEMRCVRGTFSGESEVLYQGRVKTLRTKGGVVPLKSGVLSILTSVVPTYSRDCHASVSQHRIDFFDILDSAESFALTN